MQIWRTTQSAPRTSLMKARLVRPGCFVLTMPPQKNLASSSISFVLFRYDLLYFWTPREIRWPIFGNTTNNSWNTTQYFWNTNQFCETQHKIVETQHKIAETQHKITETQHKIIETQHKVVETTQILAGRSGKRRYESMKTRQVSNMAITHGRKTRNRGSVGRREAVCLYRMIPFTWHDKFSLQILRSLVSFSVDIRPFRWLPCKVAVIPNKT